jgi:beta-glucosidase
MPWLGHAQSVLNMYLGGEAGGSAAVDLLYGDVNPSGKLAETYPLALSDTPCAATYNVHRLSAEYRESIYVGNRYYDSAQRPVLFPFGYGLSYTSFTYSDLKLSTLSMADTDELTVSFTVTNTGKVAGAEIAQLYVKAPASVLFKAEKELKGFAKVFLGPQESKTASITLNSRAFAYYNTNIHDWHVESGRYIIALGASSRDIRLTAEVDVTSSKEAVPIPDYRAVAPNYYCLKDEALHIPKEDFSALYGGPLPPNERKENEPFTLNSTFGDIVQVPLGREIYNKAAQGIAAALGTKKDPNDPMVKMGETIIKEMPLRNLAMFGAVDRTQLPGIIDLLNAQL